LGVIDAGAVNLHKEISMVRATRLTFVLLINIVLGSVSSSYAAFDPPRISYVVNPDGAGTGSDSERTYYITKGVESSINKGDLLNVYREKKAGRGAPVVKVFIGTMVIVLSQHGSSLGHFTANKEAMANPLIRHQTAMKSDIVMPILIIDASVLFDPGKMSLKPNAAQELNKMSNFVKNFSPSKLIIEGHTDSDGEAKLNQTLSEDRAEAVRQYLVVTFDFITPAMIESRGYGEERPVVPNDSPENKTLNRRIEVIVWE